MTKISKQSRKKQQKLKRRLESKQKAIDLVCGMEIEQTKYSSNHKGETYYFCSSHCKKHFDADPEMYVGEEIV